MSTIVLIEAGRRTVKSIARTSVRLGKQMKAKADCHPGVLAGVSVGYMLGRAVECVPGTQLLGKLPRYAGAAVGAAVGCVFEKAVQEVLAEGSPVRPAQTDVPPLVTD
jgi:hypothetical protein